MSLNPEQKELAAKMLGNVLSYLRCYFNEDITVEALQTELAKVGLAIQPINDKETK